MAEHLCVLVHGLWGNPVHLNYVRDTLRNQYSEDSLYILVAKSNADNNTYDGIEVGGERVANEIEQKLAELEKKGREIKKISICGYSLGGLVSRYAIGMLYGAGIFDKIEPVNFVTFASPHLGVRTPKLGYRSYMWNFMGARTLSTSGRQMFLIDSFRDTGRPLLAIMADPNSVFIKGLSLFKNRTLYANTMNDRSVPYYTAMVSRTDPFINLDRISVNYIPGQDKEVLLDPSNPVTPQESRRKNQTFYQQVKSVPRGTIKNIPFYIIFIALIPLALPAFVINAGYQTVKSAQRVKLHESGKSFPLDRYRVKLLEEAQSVQDRVYENFVDRLPADYLPTPPSETDAAVNSKEEVKVSRRERGKEKSPFPILALKEEQFEMIENLDNLGFNKYPAHIQTVRHTHAAIVVRTLKDSFWEGKVVIKHWARKFEV